MHRSGFALVLLASAVFAPSSELAAAPPNSLPMSARLLKAGEFRGFTPETPKSVVAIVRAREAQTPATKTFRVSAIPGAVGFGSDNGNPGDYMGGENIAFAAGPFLYLVGNGWSGSTEARNPRRTALIEAATKLYTRVRGD